MGEQVGLRERKKQRTHQAISDAAISLFLASGFDRVSVADIAESAEVSKRTLFKYFPTKEDLVLHRFADHEDEASRVVRERHAGEGPLTALHRHFLAGLARRDPITGLTDHPEALALYRMISTTPNLAARLPQYFARGEDALTEALREISGAGRHELTARLAASQLTTVQRTLAEENSRQLTAGRTANDLYPEAVDAANHAFDLLRMGMAAYYG